MTNPATAIPLDGPDVLIPLLPGQDGSATSEPGASTSLETQKFGILAGPKAHVELDGERRIEAWIASNLDFSVPAESAPRNVWDRIIDRLPSLRKPSKRRGSQGVSETAYSEWAHFRLAYRRGITVVRLVDGALSKESQVRELACDLIDLVEAGNHRVLINFQAVERLGSWVVLAVDEAQRRCRAAAGGALKICGLQPHLADIFPIAGMGQGIERYPDESTALESPWPDSGGPRALPVEILMALTTASEMPPLRGGAPADSSGRSKTATRRDPSSSPANSRPADKSDPGLWLIVQIGGARGTYRLDRHVDVPHRTQRGLPAPAGIADGQQTSRRHRTPRGPNLREGSW